MNLLKPNLCRSATCMLAATVMASGVAEAVMLEPGGLGQVLVFPYYTTRGGNDTLISIVNTSTTSKVLKLRFFESRNGRPVQDFHVYLGGSDVWTATIGHLPGAVGDEPGAALLTRDQSCTVPDIVNGGLGYVHDGLQTLPDGETHVLLFSNAAYSGIAQDHGDAVAATLSSLDRTREGHIEVIEMGDIVDGGQLWGWITHIASGVPGNCLAVNRAWLEPDGTFVLDPGFGLEAPNGQGHLYGNAMIVNPARGTVVGYSADAISDFNHRILHEAPGGAEPGLHSVNDPGPDGASQATAKISRDGRSVEPTYEDDGAYGKIDAISALYATAVLFNEFYLDRDVVVGASEWVLAFPTRRYYVDSMPALPHGEPFVTSAGSARAPFSNPFGDGGACTAFRPTFYDRAQRTPAGPQLPWPPRPPMTQMCWQTQVVSFGQAENLSSGMPTRILGATNYVNVSPPYGNGWMRMQTTSGVAMRPSKQGAIMEGLPMTGFYVVNLDNPDLVGGVLANYSAAFRHRSTLACYGSDSC